jgi:hypothetical protein
LQVLKSLAEAHAAGIVHRDVKPSNVFLCSYAHEPEFVKVLDFGIAKSSELEGERRSSLTREGTTVGTPAYMAPEQVAGEEVGPAADLYSLGLVMAECLSGVRVMDGPSPFAVCSAQVAPTPVPLPAAVLSSPLAAVVGRAVEKDPRRRFSSALEMLHATTHALAAAQTGAAQAWPGASPGASRPGPSGAPSAVPSPYGGHVDLAHRATQAMVATPPSGERLPFDGSHGAHAASGLAAHGAASQPPLLGAGGETGAPTTVPAARTGHAQSSSRAGVALAAALGGALVLVALVGGLVATGVLRVGERGRRGEAEGSEASGRGAPSEEARASTSDPTKGPTSTAARPVVPSLPAPPQGGLALTAGAELKGRTFCHLDDATLQKRFSDAGFRVAVVPTPQSSVFDVAGPGSAEGTVIQWRMDRMSRDFFAQTIDDGVFARDEVALANGTTRTCLLHVDLGEGPARLEQAYALLMLLTR